MSVSQTWSILIFRCSIPVWFLLIRAIIINFSSCVNPFEVVGEFGRKIEMMIPHAAQTAPTMRNLNRLAYCHLPIHGRLTRIAN